MRKVPGLLCFIVIISSLLASSSAFAQNNSYTITVRDTTKKIFLEGAIVKVTLDNAVSAKNTNIQGFCVFNLLPNKRYSITVSYMGYKSRTVNLQTKTGVNSLEIIMEEDVTKLNEIIVKAQEILMVVKDDTVKYNINSIRTMEEDDLIEAIKQLPGMTVDENGVSHMGRPVKRVYVNKTLLFGKNKSQMAYSNLKADEVKNIEVYEEDTDRAKFLGLKDGEKNTVINIVTKKKLVTVTNSNLIAATGTESGNNDKKYFLSSSYNVYNSKRYVTAAISTKNASPSFNIDKNRGRSNGLIFNYSENSIKKLELGFQGGYSFSSSNSMNILDRVYFPSQEYSTKRYIENTSAKGNAANYNLSSNIQFTIDTFNIILASVEIIDGNSENKRLRSGYMEADNTILNRFDNSSSNYTDNRSLTQVYSWSHRFRKPGRSFMATFILKNSLNTGQAWQTDTSLITTNKIKDIRNSNGLGNSISGSVSYGEPIFGGELGFRYQYVYEKGTNKRDAQNLLLNITDSLNTFNFSTSKTRQELNLYYRKNRKDFSFNSNNSIFSNRNLRNEQFPEDYIFSRQFNGVNVNFSIRKVVKTRHSFDVNYSGNTSVPALENLRGVVNNSNPLFLSAGNPDLLPAFSQSAGLRYTFFSDKGTTFGISFSGSNSYNGVTVKKITFTDETYIAKYNYTFHKGNTLNTSVNVGGVMNGIANIEFSKNIPKLRVIVNSSFSYNYRVNPYYSGDNLINQTNSSISLNFKVRSNFSKKFNFDISSESRNGVTFNSSSNSTSYFSQRLNSDIRVLFFKRISLRNSMNYYYYNKPDLSGSKINNLTWNISVAYKFKKNKGDITLTARDLLNNDPRVGTSEREDYIQSSYNNDAIRRVVMISFNYNLSTRK